MYERRTSEVRETHISLVVLFGDRVYKLKNPVRLDFVDLSTRVLLRRCCGRAQTRQSARHLWARRLRWQVGRVAHVATRRSAASESFSDHAERYGWVSPGPDDRCSAREQDAEEQRPERAETGERAEGRETGGGPGPGV